MRNPTDLELAYQIWLTKCKIVDRRTSGGKYAEAKQSGKTTARQSEKATTKQDGMKQKGKTIEPPYNLENIKTLITTLDKKNLPANIRDELDDIMTRLKEIQNFAGIHTHRMIS